MPLPNARLYGQRTKEVNSRTLPNIIFPIRYANRRKMIIEKNNLSKMFSDIAPDYDFLNSVLSLNSDKSWRRKIIDIAQIKENFLILDLCTGTAEIAIECVRREKTCQVFGVDFSRVMLDKAKDKINKLHLGPQIHLIEADVFRLPFPASSFDLVSIGFGLRNLIDPLEGIKKIADMLKTRGKILILEFSPPPKNLLGRVSNFYLNRIVPLVANILGGSSDAYNYLASSIRTFLYPEQILNCMKLAGLKDLRIHKMCFGAVNLYYAEK